MLLSVIAPTGTNICSSQKFANLEHKWPLYCSPTVNCHWVLTLKISVFYKKIRDMSVYCWRSACFIVILNNSKMNHMIVSLCLPSRCEMHVAWNVSGPASLFWAQQHEFIIFFSYPRYWIYHVFLMHSLCWNPHWLFLSYWFWNKPLFF